MTEIPEHLLKRSRERRQAMGGAPEGGEAAAPAPAEGGTDAGGGTASTALTPSAPAAPAARPEPAPPPPDRPEVAAAKSRRKIPIWAMATLSLLPIWAFIYARTLTAREEVVEGPLGVGAAVYASNCASCHQGDGSGGAGRPLWKGEVLKTFPGIEDMLNFVYTGSQPYAGRGYGDPAREGGQHQGLSYNGAAMPAFGGQLTDAEILAVVCHERFTLAGADPTSTEYAEQYDTYCSPDAQVWADVEAGTTFAELEGVGTEPRP